MQRGARAAQAEIPEPGQHAQGGTLSSDQPELANPPCTSSRRASYKLACRPSISAMDRRINDVWLISYWRLVAKPRRAGHIPAQPESATAAFGPLFQEWLRQRGLTSTLEATSVGDPHGWIQYRYTPLGDQAVRAGPRWEQAFHGSLWYSLWSTLESGVLLESDDRAKGHDYWMPGGLLLPGLRHRALVRSAARALRRRRISPRNAGASRGDGCPQDGARARRRSVGLPGRKRRAALGLDQSQFSSRHRC